MNFAKDLPRFALFAVIGGLLLLLLQQWVGFSKDYDQKQLALLKAKTENSVSAADINYANDFDAQIDNSMASTTETEDEYAPPINETNSSIITADDNSNDQTIPRSNREIVVTTDTLRVTIDSQIGRAHV